MSEEHINIPQESKPPREVVDLNVLKLSTETRDQHAEEAKPVSHRLTFHVLQVHVFLGVEFRKGVKAKGLLGMVRGKDGRGRVRKKENRGNYD